MSAQRLNRMKVEFSTLTTAPPPGVTCRVDDANSDVLIATVTGPEGSPFEDGHFEIEISLSDRYPFTPPIAKFLTPIYHPNIDPEGRICLSGLKSKPSGSWNCSMNIATILSAIRILLGEPNLSDPLMTNIAEEYRSNYATYLEKAKSSARKCFRPRKCDTSIPSTDVKVIPAPLLSTVEPDMSETMEEDLFPVQESDGDDVCLSPIIKSQITNRNSPCPVVSTSIKQDGQGTKLRPSEVSNNSVSRGGEGSIRRESSKFTKSNSSDRPISTLVAPKSSVKLNNPAFVPTKSIPDEKETKLSSYTGSQKSSQSKPITMDDFLFDSEDDDDDFASVPNNPTKKLKFS